MSYETFGTTKEQKIYAMNDPYYDRMLQELQREINAKISELSRRTGIDHIKISKDVSNMIATMYY